MRRIFGLAFLFCFLQGSSVSFLQAADKSIPPPQWQSGDPVLAAKWADISGRYMFHHACGNCHEWGPKHWSRSQWETYLQKFPGNHEPDIGDRLKDLTAMIDAGKSMPSRRQQHDTLAQFILDQAPEKELSPEEADVPFNGAPRVGDKAAGFAIEDIRGGTIKLSQFSDEKPLVLVFSRAYW